MAVHDYLNKAYLLNATKEEVRLEVHAENSPLFSLQYHFLANSESMLESLRQYTVRMRNPRWPGVYDQLPVRCNCKDDYTSPDQLIAFVGTLYLNEQIPKIKEINKYLLKHFFTYDNVRPGSFNPKRFMQPSAVLFTSVASGNWWLYPALSGTLLYSCAVRKGETSGKLKAWTMMKTLDMGVTMRICTKILRGFKSWKAVFQTYYPAPDHPNHVLSDKLW